MKNIYLASLLLITVLPTHSQYSVVRDDFRTALLERTPDPYPPRGNPYIQYYHEISPWQNWVLQLREFRSTGKDSVEVRIFPANDTANIHKLTTIYPSNKSEFLVSIREDMTSVALKPWSLLQGEIRFAARATTINSGIRQQPEFFSIDVSAITWVKISGLEFAPIRQTVNLNNSKLLEPSFDFSIKRNISGNLDVNYLMANPGHVYLNIFGINGELINTKYQGYQKQGIHKFTWGIEGENGNHLSPGKYLIQMNVGNEIKTKRQTITR